MRLRRLHALSALVIGTFAVFHLGNHLVSLAGIQAHIDVMDALRTVYRFLPVEILLLASVAFQIGSGLTMAIRGWKERKGLIPWLQAGSGLYLAFFFLAHVGAVLAGRSIQGLDTNFHFAAAGMHVPPWQLFFAPYYLLSVTALFTHIGCAIYWNTEGKPEATRRRWVFGMLGAGGLLGLVLVMSLGGVFHEVQIPAAYLATFGDGA